MKYSEAKKIVKERNAFTLGHISAETQDKIGVLEYIETETVIEPLAQSFSDGWNYTVDMIDNYGR